MASYPLIGKKTVYIDDMIIPPDYIQDEVGTITLTPSTTEIASQSGTIKVPNGSYDVLTQGCRMLQLLNLINNKLPHYCQLTCQPITNITYDSIRTHPATYWATRK